MREIKFRGKSTTEFDDKKIWLYGDLLQPIEICDIYEISDCNSIDGSRYQVDEDTIGQYTGLKDKTGKKIYEGDIVKITEKEKISKHKVISMKPIIADIEWSEEYLTYILITTSVKDAFESLTDYLDECDIEVIGNIYDNPELLGGE